MIDFACKTFRIEEVVKCSLGLTRSELRVLQEVLADSSSWVSAEQFSEALEVDITTAQRALKKLYEAEIVDRHQENLSSGGYVYVYRAKPRPEVQERIIAILRSWLSRAEKEIRAWT